MHQNNYMLARKTEGKKCYILKTRLNSIFSQCFNYPNSFNKQYTAAFKKIDLIMLRAEHEDFEYRSCKTRTVNFCMHIIMSLPARMKISTKKNCRILGSRTGFYFSVLSHYSRMLKSLALQKRHF